MRKSFTYWEHDTWGGRIEAIAGLRHAMVINGLWTLERGIKNFKSGGSGMTRAWVYPALDQAILESCGSVGVCRARWAGARSL